MPLSKQMLSRLRTVLRKARNRKKEFDLCIDDLISLYEDQQGLCVYSKAPLSSEANRYNTLSLDRIDSSKGYIVGNVQLVCADINQMKWNMDEGHFLRLCSVVANNTHRTT